MRGQTVIGFMLGALVGAAGMWWMAQGEVEPPLGNVPVVTDMDEGAVSGAMLAGDDDAAVARLRTDLAAAQARVGELETARSKLTAKTDRSPGGSPVRTPGSTPKSAPKPMPKQLLALGGRLGVREVALALAWAIRTGQVEDRAAAIAKLKAFGEQGLMALAALAIGPGTGHTMLPALMGQMAVVDGGEILMRLISEHEKSGLLVTALVKYDTPQVRDFLVDRLGKTEKDAGVYWKTAVALGLLKETRGAEFLDVQAIIQPGWGGVRGHILQAIGRMGGSHAAQRLTEYLALPHADHLGAALTALARIDQAAAREHARRILAGERGPFLSYSDRVSLKKLAEEK